MDIRSWRSHRTGGLSEIAYFTYHHDDPPVVFWTHPGGDIAGFDFYLGAEAQRVKVNTGLLTGSSYTDTGYAGDQRIYTVIAVDPNNVQSPGRTVTLPEIHMSLSTTSLQRGIMKRLEYEVKKGAEAPLPSFKMIADGNI